MGSHQVSWLATAGVPLFISHRRLAGRKTFPRAAPSRTSSSSRHCGMAKATTIRICR
ncbi:DUF7221 family queuine tRNA-ribosyltransferase-like protein [Mycolicibacterium sphagni]|uniref:deazapurine DNA modification protein DpdA family protein n=1 Tax=Mycolicibacterium sphagni TaxID=1786 RepID=UPI003D2FE866